MNSSSHVLRRRELVAAAFATVAVGGAGSARAAGYPDKPIRMILPVSPGSAVDATARRLAPPLEAAFGQSMVLDNKPGSAGLIATTQLVRSPADGYTLGMVASTHCITPHLYKASFHPLRDVQPIVTLTSGPMLFVVHDAVPAKDVRQFVAYAKSRPESKSVAMGNSGNGTTNHIACALMSLNAGFKALHVAYRGMGALATDLAGGQVDAGFLPLVAAMPLVKAGQLRILGVSTATRLASMDNVPSLAESGVPDFDMDAWVALIAPKGTPRAIVDRINAEVNKALRKPDVERSIAEGGGGIIGGSVKQCEDLFQNDYNKYGKVIAQAGIKAD